MQTNWITARLFFYAHLQVTVVQTLITPQYSLSTVLVLHSVIKEWLNNVIETYICFIKDGLPMSILSDVTYMLTEKPSNIFYMLQLKDGTDYSLGNYSI